MTPLPCTWNGEAFEVARGFRRNADQTLVIGEKYIVEIVEERSAKSHKQYFAAINDLWHSLPESAAEQFPTPEHLRKFALIKCGYANHRQFVASSKAEALRIAAFVRPTDEYAVVSVDGNIVNQWTAQSQNMRAMGKQAFQASKEAVLDYIGALLGVDHRKAA
jgi:hypothetical protein